MNAGRLWQLVRKEFRQMLRDPRSQRMLFVSPVIQLLLFGYKYLRTLPSRRSTMRLASQAMDGWRPRPGSHLALFDSKAVR